MASNSTLKKDLEFGLKSEEKVKGTLEQAFGCPLTKQSSFCRMDFRNSSSTLYVELKTRRIRHNQYDTIIIGANKVRFCTDPDKDYYFVYSCLDGIYYIKYDEELFSTFDGVRGFERNTRDEAHVNHPTDVVLIPTKLLKKLGSEPIYVSEEPLVMPPTRGVPMFSSVPQALSP